MKKLMRIVCLVLALSLCLAVPAHADAAVEPRESIFFSSYFMALERATSTSFKIWFDVDSNAAMMDVLGVSEIVVYRSQDQETWRKMKTYKMENYPEMTDTYCFSHTGYVTYNYATSGFYYTARITFYAQDSRGIGVRDFYTEIILM